MSFPYYDKAGRLIGQDQYLHLFGDGDYQLVAKSLVSVDPLVEVSTVWLGIDHGFIMDGPPVIFETMVFGGPLNEECWRYCTEGQALAGHAEVVALVELELEHGNGA